MSKICSACGKEVEETLANCPYCGGSVTEETAEERIRRIALAAEEEERRIIAQRKAERAAAAKKKKRILAIVAAAVLALTVILVINTVIIPGNVYKEAEALRTEGKYLEAMELYYSKPDHSGCRERIDEFEGMLWEALSGITWEDPEHIYMKNHKSGGSYYDVAILHQLDFDPATKICGQVKWYRYYKVKTGTYDFGNSSSYDSTFSCSFLVEEGKVYVYGIRDLGMIQLNGTIEEGRAVIETLTCTVEMSSATDNYQTTFKPY